MIKEFDFFPHAFTAREGGFSVPATVLYDTTKIAFERVSFFFSQEHIEHLIEIALSKSASKNDRYVASVLLKNALVSAQGVLPSCQDTGIAQIFGFKRGNVFTVNEEKSISQAVADVYTEKKLRNSTVCACTFYDEFDEGHNLPAQIMLLQSMQTDYGSIVPQFAQKNHYRFLFCAKGGGSANKTQLIQATKAEINPTNFEQLLKKHITELGTAACPPYCIAVVVGGLSAEQNIFMLKLATCNFFDSLTATAYSSETPIFRDAALEKTVLRIAAETGFGAQFGGEAMAITAVVLRLPRHAASFPVSIGVSCSAHRNIEAYITKEGVYIEKKCTDLYAVNGFDEALVQPDTQADTIKVNTNDGITECVQKLKNLATGTSVLLSGKVLIARDQAHAKWNALVEGEKQLPDYCSHYPICYAGPAQTPEGKIIGSIGPTTALRMDTYADMLMSRGAALITIAKGNRQSSWREACKQYGAVYLGTIGGAAAVIAEEHITSARIVDYPELGMEAARLIEVKDLPVFVIINGKGEDFFSAKTP